MTETEKLAGWVCGLTCEDVPDRVLELCRNQFASVLAAVFAGAGSEGGGAVTRAVRGLGGGGPCALYPGGSGAGIFEALLQNCALSMALDYDDYLFMGHTGHSAVLVPVAVSEMRGADTETVLAASVAANEVAGRLGASVILGPHNGQMWAYIHLLGAAAAASRVLGLDREATADAMGIAMSQPVYPLFSGFMGPQSKLMTAAYPAVTGTAAAFLAEEGMTGPRGVLEEPRGFWDEFAFVPLRLMMGGVGRSWVTDTIAFKPYPGCAYIDTTMDALFRMMAVFREERGRKLDPGEVRSVRVEASVLTVAMDSMSRGYLETDRLSPTNINFSVPLSVAIGILAGGLGGAHFTGRWLEENRAAILDVASRVEVAHCASMTVEFIRSLDEVVDLAAVLREVGFRELAGARRELRRHLSNVGTLGRREAVSAWRSLDSEDRSFMRGLLAESLSGRGGKFDLGDCRFDRMRMPFGARVEVNLSDGGSLYGEQLVPRGGPSDPGRLDVPAEKFCREVGARLGGEAAALALEKVLCMDGGGPEAMRAAMSEG